MAHHILYIPGLGDHNVGTQTRIIKQWNKFGLETHLMSVNWTDNEPYESKLKRVLKEIDALSSPDNKISLVGTSAGAGMALNAYVARKDAINGVVYICGKLRNPQSVGEPYFRKNPAFRKSVFAAGANVQKLTDADKAKMLTIRSLFDGTIPTHDSRIPGVKNRTLPVLLHVFTIFFAITLFKKITINFLKARTE